MMRARSAPADQAQTLRGLGLAAGHDVSGTGLVILWVTGILMVFFSGLAGSLPGCSGRRSSSWWWLTVLNGLIHKTYAEMRRTGDVALAQRLMMFGPASACSVLLAFCSPPTPSTEERRPRAAPRPPAAVSAK